MGLSLGGLCLFTGVATLFYAAYAVIAYRDELKLTQQDFEGVPGHVVSYVCLGLGLGLLGSHLLSGEFRPIAVSKGAHTMDLHALRSDFLSFNHRSRAIPMKIPSIEQ